MNPHNKLKQTAIKVASYGNVKRAKMAALAFSESGELIASCHNRRINSQKNKWTEHAEEGLIRKLKKLKAFNRYGKISILVLRFNIYGVAMAKPCKQCQRLLARHNIDVFYTNGVGEIIRLVKEIGSGKL